MLSRLLAAHKIIKDIKFSDTLLIQQSKELQDAYNNEIKDLVNKEIAPTTGISKSVDDMNKLEQKVLEECNINAAELLKEGIEINEHNPNISSNDLAIELLHKIANNKKHKKMSKIAKEMIKERWWQKNE